MKRLAKLFGLLGLAGSAFAGPSSPPAGNYIQNVSTLVASPAYNVSSGTVRTQLNLGYGTQGNLLYLSTGGVVTTTTTAPTGGDVFKASTQTFTGFNTFVGSTTFNRQVKVQTTQAGQGTGTGGSILVWATDETGMPFQIYTSSANQAGYFGLVNLIASNTNYANAMIYITGTSSSTAKADLYINNPRPNIQLYQTGGASPYGQFEFVVAADTLQFNAMNAGGSAQKARLGMTHAGALAFYETTDNGHFVALKASATIASNVTWVMPDADGSSGQFLKTNGSGVLSWGTSSGSGGGGLQLQPSTTTITISSGLAFSGNAGTAGQILSSQGAGTVPQWITASGVGDAVLASTQTFSGQNTFLNMVTVSSDVFIRGAKPLLSTSTLQSGATFYVSSGTVFILNANQIKAGVLITSSTILAGEDNLTNVGVGVNASTSTTSGSGNVAVGYTALPWNKTGANNTAIGHLTNKSSTANSNNTAVGYTSLYATKADDNTAVGAQSMLSNITGTQNVSIGKDSLLNQTSGNNNTAVGYNSCGTNDGGSTVTCLGSSSNVGSSSLQNATAIGASAVVTASNMMQLGQAGTRVNTSTITVSIMTVSSTATFNGGVAISSTLALSGSYGTSGQVLTSGGGSTVPTWTTPSAGGGGITGTINAAQIYSAAVYSLAGSSTVISGSSIMAINTSSVVVVGPLGIVNTYGNDTGSQTVRDLTASQMVRTDGNKKLISSATLTTTELTGILAAAQFPVLTGDVTTVAGALATTAAASQPNIKTFTSTITVSNTGGIKTVGPVLGTSFTFISPTYASQVTSNTILGSTTFYADGKAVIGGAITATNLSGTNTGDQTITLTGDVTGTGTGSFATTAAPTQANIRNFTSTLTMISSVTISTNAFIGGATFYNDPSGGYLAIKRILWPDGTLQVSSPTVGAGGAGNPGGSPSQVQYNSAGSFAGAAGFTVTATSVGISNAYTTYTSTLNVSSSMTVTAISSMSFNGVNIVMSGDISFSSTALYGIRGSTLADDASPGDYGESGSSVAATTNAAATTQWGNLASQSLTPGNWLISGCVNGLLNGATSVGQYGIAISINSGNTTTDHVAGQNQMHFLPPTTSVNSGMCTPTYRLKLGSTTTVYLKGLATYTVGTPQFNGSLNWVRPR